MKQAFSLLAALIASPLLAAERADVLVADFEGDTYPDGWKTTGTAFGKGPAKGTLPDQMAVSGFLGKRLVNSFLDGDKTTGTLTSSVFKIERKYLNFLVGGGKHAKTCVNLLVGEKVVRTATGPNDKPGGSERLDWHSWDVAEFEGKEVVIQIVDEETGGWGHINADHFVQSDRKKQAEPFVRNITGETRYLHLPVKTGAPVRRMTFVVDKEVVREFDIELADGEKPDYWAFADVAAFKDKGIAIKATVVSGKSLDAIHLSNDVPDAEKLYREKHRPLFHFTSRFGWLNDPNGLVYHDKEWHLFYQHNPFGVNWGNMHWGHAVSGDLVRWKEQGIALYPKKYGDWAFSGSAVVDKGNTSGWGTAEKPPLVLAYTSTGRGECVAYSTDNGRTWTEYEKNPVVKHAGRDPKLVWYEKGKHWVMAVYDEHEKKQWIAFYTSPDLKAWAFASRIEGFYECPDLFELTFGERETRWVLYGADGKYLLGDFDGKEFKPHFKEKKQLWYGNFYAAQTFDDDLGPLKGFFEDPTPPFPWRFQIGWARGVTFPGMPFNQQMTAPVVLSLARGEVRDVPRLIARPVASLDELRVEPPAFTTHGGGSRTVANRFTPADDLDAFDCDFIIDPQKATGFTFDLRGTELTYDVAKGTLTCKDVTAPVKLRKPGLLDLRVLVDRGSVEVFVNGGEVALSVAAVPGEKNRKLEVVAVGGEVKLVKADVYRMKSAWEK